MSQPVTCPRCLKPRMRGHHHDRAILKSLAERFAAKVVPEPISGCHLWTGAVNKQGGYGVIGVGRDADGLQLAHRVAWGLAHGPIPEGLSVLHRCDVPACVNPAHLFLGDQRANLQDMARKGRGRRRRHAP